MHQALIRKSLLHMQLTAVLQSRAHTVCAFQWTTVRWTELNFLGLLPKSSKDEWDYEIKQHFPYDCYSKICLSPFEYPYFFEWVFRKMFWTLLDYTVAKVYTTPRNSTRFTRPFLLLRARGWGLGTRLCAASISKLSTSVVRSSESEFENELEKATEGHAEQ